MLRKVTSTLKFSAESIFNNKLRFLLSVLGIVLSAIIFSIGVITIDTYYNYQYSKYNNYTPETILIEGQISNQDYLQLLNERIAVVYPYSQIITGVPIKVLENNERKIEISVDVIGTTNQFENYLTPNFSHDYTLTSYELVKGRGLKVGDLEQRLPVAVVDSFAAELLFMGEDPLGKTINIPIIEEIMNDGAIERSVTHFKKVEIIGVIDNEISTTEQKNHFNSMFDEDHLKVKINLYVPYTLSGYLGNDSQQFNQIILHSKELLNQELLNKLNSIFNRKSTESISRIHTKNMLFNDISNSIKNTKNSLQIIVFLIILIIGIIIMNTMFFSVKERVSEIGIKKALGATNSDIMIHFLIEGTIIGVIGSITGTIIGMLGSFTVIAWMKLTMFPYLIILVDNISILLILIICTLQSVIFTVIPAIYGARIKIVDAIRFE